MNLTEFRAEIEKHGKLLPKILPDLKRVASSLRECGEKNGFQIRFFLTRVLLEIQHDVSAFSFCYSIILGERYFFMQEGEQKEVDIDEIIRGIERNNKIVSVFRKFENILKEK